MNLQTNGRSQPLRCLFCPFQGSKAELIEHSAKCEKHPMYAALVTAQGGEACYKGLLADVHDLRDDCVRKIWALQADLSAARAELAEAFQFRVRPWMIACFGETISADRDERNRRFIEEALELVQACGGTVGECHALVDYVFSRPVGERPQEVGGVMVTLAALCLAQGIDMHECGEVELRRVGGKIEQIRAKQAAKPKHSPLPIDAALAPSGGQEVEG